MIQPDATPDDGGEAVHSSLPPAEQITQPSHDDEGLIERLLHLLNFHAENGYARSFMSRGEARDFANTISRLKGERAADRALAAWVRKRNCDTPEQAERWHGKMNTRIEAAESRALQLEAEVKELREALAPFAKVAGPIKGEEGRPTYLDTLIRDGGTDELAVTTIFDTGGRGAVLWADDFRKARSLLTKGEVEDGFGSARASRDARSSTRPDSPHSDEGGNRD